MAKSPAHAFGQIIGDVLEVAIEPVLSQFAQEKGLYLDKKGHRPARRGVKVSWTDLSGNVHDLDFVLEKDGSLTKIGTPVAFIETAWRSYTKHSRNKAQEIQGAIMPLAATYQNSAPFIAAILAGVFTEGALTQLTSLGFTILYFSYNEVVKAFRVVGIDASFGENTPDADIEQKISAWEALSNEQRISVANALIKNCSEDVARFIHKLDIAVSRQIDWVRVLPLHGAVFNGKSLEEAIEYIEKYDEVNGSKLLVRYEIEIHYSNGDSINGKFEDRDGAILFLRKYQHPTSLTDQLPHGQLSLLTPQ